ncbi:MAG TPA: Uma2 family endonuclease [Urbifossiella sp.]|nr:Uma2 family endonuclease [Urbifossiella sp.]
MSVLFLDPSIEKKTRADDRRDDRRDEVWEGVLVVPPTPNNEHYRLVSRLNTAFSAVINWDRGDSALPGGNVSDRDKDWMKNYRVPDVLVYLAGSPAIDRDTHWVGSPDFLVEVISPGEDPQSKLDFYAKVGTRELLIIDRAPWSLELYQLKKGKLHSTGRSEAPRFASLTSKVLPLTFALRKGSPRPVIHLSHTATGQIWTA